MGFLLWRHQVILEVIAGAGVRQAAVAELAALLGACLAAAAIASSMPWIDRGARRRIHLHALGWGIALAAAFATLPLLPLLAMHVSPGLLPVGTPVDVSFDERAPLDVYLPVVGALVTANIAYVGLALGCVALLGRQTGPAAAGGIGLAIIVLQVGARPWLPLWGGAGEPPYGVHPDGVLAAAALLVTGLALWVRSRGGSRAEHRFGLIRRARWPLGTR